MDCLIKLELFRSNYKKTKGKSEDPNMFTRIFGSTVPKNIPESVAYFSQTCGWRHVGVVFHARESFANA